MADKVPTVPRNQAVKPPAVPVELRWVRAGSLIFNLDHVCSAYFDEGVQRVILWFTGGHKEVIEVPHAERIWRLLWPQAFGETK